MKAPRKPAAFRVDPDVAGPAIEEPAAPAARRPRAVGTAVVTPDETDAFALDLPAPVPPTSRRRSRLGAIFITAFGLLLSLAAGIWTEALIRELFARADWLGWTAAGLAAIAGTALLALLARELLALSRLASVEKLRTKARDAIDRDDPKAARAVAEELADMVGGSPETAAGRRALSRLRGEIIDGANLVRLAEIEVLAPLDAKARTMIMEAAKRVSVVTAVSPRALVDLAYVVFESGRLVRKLSELYGGRPGTLGFFRLARAVLAHLAVTGAIAAGDDFVHQVVGQGLAARLSARLGEGVVNGMMTARIGVAAMEVARPLPFSALKRPGIGEFLAALGSAVTRKGERQSG